MPLIKSGTREAISKNIKTEKAAGRPQAQAVAIALDTARRAGAKIPKKEGGGTVKKYDEGGEVSEDTRQSGLKQLKNLMTSDREGVRIGKESYKPGDLSQAARGQTKSISEGVPRAYAKGGDVRVQEDRARGGPVITTRSKFLKTPDVFRTDTERTDYDKSGKGGELSKTEGDTKSQKPIKPRT